MDIQDIPDNLVLIRYILLIHVCIPRELEAEVLGQLGV